MSHLEAIRHFDRGLGIVATLSQGPDRDGREIELQLARGLSLFTAEGFISAGAAESYTRARDLAERRGDARHLSMAVYGLWQATAGSGNFLAGRSLSARLLALTAGGSDDGLRLQAHHSAWTTGLFSGDPVEGRKHTAAGRELYDPERHRAHRFLYGGHDPGVCAQIMGGLAEWTLGYAEQAVATSGEGLALAERLAHPFSLQAALFYNAMLNIDWRDPESALKQIGKAEALVAEQRLGFYFEPRFLRGGTLTLLDAPDEAVACLREGLTRPLGAVFARPYGLARLAEALARRGELEAALAAAREGLDAQKPTACCLWEAELRRLEGISLSALNRLEEGQNALEEALSVAQKQQAKSYELRAATSLARLWGEQGRRKEARELLAPVYGWFTEGFDTADLREARSLLDQLA